MIDYGTEAEHLADIDDYDLEESYEDWERSYTFDAKGRCFSEPYEDWEKKLYLDAKGRCFSENDIGKFVIIQNSRRKKDIMPTMFLVDRHKTKCMWWLHLLSLLWCLRRNLLLNIKQRNISIIMQE